MGDGGVFPSRPRLSEESTGMTRKVSIGSIRVVMWLLWDEGYLGSLFSSAFSSLKFLTLFLHPVSYSMPLYSDDIAAGTFYFYFIIRKVLLYI